MRPLTSWLNDYGSDHLNATNRKIHRVCVPLIFFAVVGLLHLLPFHSGDGLILLALVWYAFLGLRALALMLIQVGVCISLTDIVSDEAPGFCAYILIGVFIVGWIGQFYGHHLEGRRPSFFKDLQYLLIGPLWVWLGRH